MRRGNKRIWTVLIILTLAFIWGNSLLPPQASWAVSDTVQRILSYFTPVEAPSDGAEGFWGAVVRKLAHFTEFCVLGGLLRLRFYGTRRAPWLPLLAGLLAALTDETIQYYTGRTSLVFDVWIDFAGTAVGVLLLTCLPQRRERGVPRAQS